MMFFVSLGSFGNMGSLFHIYYYLSFVINEMINQLVYCPNELKSYFDLSLFNYLVKCRIVSLTYFEKQKLYQGHSMSLLGRLSYHPIRNHNLFFLASVQVYINHGMGEIHTFPQGNRVPLSVFMNKMFFRYVRFMALHKKLPQINE